MGQLSWSHCQGVQTVGSLGLRKSPENQEDLTKHLRVDLSETEAKGAAHENIAVLEMLQES